LDAPVPTFALIAVLALPVLHAVGQADARSVGAALRGVKPIDLGAEARGAASGAARPKVVPIAPARPVTSAAVEARAVAVARNAEAVDRTLYGAVGSGKSRVADARSVYGASRGGGARLGAEGTSEADAALVAERSGPEPKAGLGIAVTLANAVASPVIGARSG
jgi:hypothetical protein